MSSPVIADTAIGTSCRRSERLVAVTMISCSTCMSRGGVSAAVASGACSAAVVSKAVNGNQMERRTAIMGFYPCSGPFGRLFRIYLKFSIWVNFSFGTIFRTKRNRSCESLFALGNAGAGIVLSARCAAVAAELAYDVVIRNGRLLDGLGNPWIRGCIAIKDGRIARIGHCDGRAPTRDRRARSLRLAGLDRPDGSVR